VLRTNIVDSGLGMRVFGIFCRGMRVVEGEAEAGARRDGEGAKEKGEAVDEGAGGDAVMEAVKPGEAEAEAEGGETEEEVELEDRRVLGAALAAVCNIVNEFSPLRPASVFLLCLELF
jgi:armadillo repeat-containing protein 8